MNILVYNLAAEYAGALTVLKEFYNEVLSCEDKSHTWYFVVSTDELKEADNIKILRIPWVKKSWLHRWWYDKFCARKLIPKYKIDRVFSMQNMTILGVKCEQIVYFHQPLQFSPVKYSLFKREERTYWIRQNVICNLIRKSLKKANTIIVQTHWMKDATHKWLKDKQKDIVVLPPKISLKKCCTEEVERENNLFVYPAGDGLHKNHKLIIEACDILSSKDVPYKVLFTMDASESAYANAVYKEVKSRGLDIQFTGFLDNAEIMKLYKQGTLIFPSYLETFGLPLLEARISNGVILCSDMPFAHEILDGYDNAYFFDVGNAEQLARYMEDCCNGKVEQKDFEEEFCLDEQTRSIVDCILEGEL